jgi:uracil-DNA glycosylase family 4
MSFISAPLNSRLTGIGPKDSKIVLVGESPEAEDLRRGTPLSGPAGSVLEQCLHAAGITRSDCYYTTVIKEKITDHNLSPWYSITKKQLTPKGLECVDALHKELAELSPNVIVTFGAVAMKAMLNTASVAKFRGYVFPGLTGVKVIPTMDPIMSIRGNFIYRYYISSDLKKAKIESTFPELRRPERELITEFSSIAEAIEWVEVMSTYERLSIDIEVLNYEIALIGISPSPELAVSIPLADACWRDQDEVPLWRALQSLLCNPYIVKIFQNGIFDIHFLATKCGMLVRGKIEDTMMAHSIMYPDMLKGLGFLGSLYCGSQVYWKDAISWDNIKKEA